jgi:hypothetical protein
MAMNFQTDIIYFIERILEEYMMHHSVPIVAERRPEA